MQIYPFICPSNGCSNPPKICVYIYIHTYSNGIPYVSRLRMVCYDIAQKIDKNPGDGTLLSGGSPRWSTQSNPPWKSGNPPWKMDGLPSGKHTNNYGKSPFLMGKSTISAIFNSYVSLPEGNGKYRNAYIFVGKALSKNWQMVECGLPYP